MCVCLNSDSSFLAIFEHKATAATAAASVAVTFAPASSITCSSITFGIRSLQVASKEVEVFENYDAVPENLRTQITPKLFPPDAETADNFKLERYCELKMVHPDLLTREELNMMFLD